MKTDKVNRKLINSLNTVFYYKVRPISKLTAPPSPLHTHTFRKCKKPIHWHMCMTFFPVLRKLCTSFSKFLGKDVRSCGSCSCNATVVSALGHGAESQYEILFQIGLGSIRRVRPQFPFVDSCKWQLLYDNARSYTATWVKRFLTKHNISELPTLHTPLILRL